MSVLELPEPGDWRERQRLVPWLLLLTALGVAVAYCALGVVAASDGRYLTPTVTFGWAAFLLLFLVGVSLTMLGRITPRIVCDATGFTLLPDRRSSILILAGVVATIPSTVIFAIAAPMGAIDFANTTLLQIAWPMAAGFLIVTIISGLIKGGRRGSMGHVKLTPAMVENADILTTHLCEWEDVVDVVGHAESKKAHRAVVLRLRNGGEEVIGNVNVYVPGGAALYWMVRHYWKHPEDRDELVDERAAKRLREGRFDLS